MYAICCEYAKELDIRFNPAKFQFLSFNGNESASLEGTLIESTTTAIHLGHEIGINCQELKLSLRRICNDIH